MRLGKTEHAAALAGRIGIAIKEYNSAELSRIDALKDPHSMWSKVRQLTGRRATTNVGSTNFGITAEVLNNHYAAISHDASYAPPSVKLTVNNKVASPHISEWRMFKTLDTLRNTASGLDNIPAWFLRIGAPFLAAPVASLMNLSLSSSVVPSQWKTASILPIAKVSVPLSPSDYRPISITPVLSRVLERIVVTDFVYPSLRFPLLP